MAARNNASSSDSTEVNLTGGACLQVGRTAVPASKVVRVETHEAAADTANVAAFFGTLLAKLLGLLRQQDVGRYLLSHGPGADSIQCLQQLKDLPAGVRAADCPAADHLQGSQQGTGHAVMQDKSKLHNGPAAGCGCACVLNMHSVSLLRKTLSEVCDVSVPDAVVASFACCTVLPLSALALSRGLS